MKELLQTTLPLGKKLHGIFHLLSSLVFVCLFVNALLTVPLLIFRNLYPEFMELTRYTLITAVNLVALTLFYYNGTRAHQKQQKMYFFTHYPIFLVIYMAMSVQNALAVMQGFLGSSSVFVRTPKFAVNSIDSSSYLKRKVNWINIFELMILCYFIIGIILSIYFDDYFMMLFFLMIGFGLGLIIYQSLLLVDSKRLLKSVKLTKLKAAVQHLF